MEEILKSVMQKYNVSLSNEEMSIALEEIGKLPDGAIAGPRRY